MQTHGHRVSAVGDKLCADHTKWLVSACKLKDPDYTALVGALVSLLFPETSSADTITSPEVSCGTNSTPCKHGQAVGN